jgi:hypothetical protein
MKCTYYVTKWQNIVINRKEKLPHFIKKCGSLRINMYKNLLDCTAPKKVFRDLEITFKGA